MGYGRCNQSKLIKRSAEQMSKLQDNLKVLPLLLVVDSSEETASVLSDLLGHACRLKFAKNGEEALTLSLAAEKPDLVLLDTVLPDFDGYEVSRQLRETDSTREIPIVFLSATNDPQDQVKAFESGCVDYITKPFDPETTLIRIQSHLTQPVDDAELADIDGQVRDDERKRISREIHDELGQLLSALRMQISGIKAQKDDVKNLPEDKLHFISTLVEKAQTATKDIVAGLRSPAYDLNLVDAVKWQIDEFIRNTKIPCDLSVSDEVVSLDHGHTLTITRIVQEALTNVMRYANATEVEVKLLHFENHLILVVRDNGDGFDMTDKKESSFGLVGIKERAEMLGGVARVVSKPDYGTFINVIIPT